MKTLLLFFLFTLFTLSLSAQTGEEELYIQLKQSNQHLNETYKELKAKMSDIKDRTALIASQNTWLKYRDAHCKFISKEESEGGVIANKIKVNCLVMSTEERIAILKDLMKEF